MTQSPDHITPHPETRADNGILSNVPSQYVGRAQLGLPDAALFPGDEVQVDVDAGWLGRVRLTFRKYRYTRPKGKFSATAWSCRHAIRVEAVAEPSRSLCEARSEGALDLDRQGVRTSGLGQPLTE